MKKYIFTVLLLISLANLHAQELAPNAIGIRIGSYDAMSTELTYQRRVSNHERLEFDFGYRKDNKKNKNYDSYKFTGLYNYVWHFDKRFNGFVGLDGGLGKWNNYTITSKDIYNGFYFFGGVQFGTEYSFKDIPLIISLDFRHEMYFSDFKNKNEDNFKSNIGLGIKYRF